MKENEFIELKDGLKVKKSEVGFFEIYDENGDLYDVIMAPDFPVEHLQVLIDHGQRLFEKGLVDGGIIQQRVIRRALGL